MLIIPLLYFPSVQRKPARLLTGHTEDVSNAFYQALTSSASESLQVKTVYTLSREDGAETVTQIVPVSTGKRAAIKFLASI